MSLQKIRKNYREKVFRLLGHRKPRRYAYRHPWKFIKILTASSDHKIRKRLQLNFFETLRPEEKERILGLQFNVQERGAKNSEPIDFPIPELEELGLSYEDYIEVLREKPVSIGGDVMEPKFSIIIPVYEQFAMTYDCLCSLSYHYGNRQDVEVVIADDSIQEDYSSLLIEKGAKGIIVQSNESGDNGFLPNCNQASEVARGQYIIFLNNDTVVLPGWLEGLERHHSEQNKIVGSKLIYSDGVLQEAGGGIFSDGSAVNIGKFCSNNHPYYNFSRTSDYVSGASFCVERAWFLNSGQFDRRYSPAYYEDTDLCVRAKKEGFNVVYSAESKLIHLEGRSCGSDVGDSTSIKRFQDINHKKFLEKWDLSCYLPPESKHDHSNLIHKRETILVVCPYPVRTDTDSGCKRMFYIVSILQGLYDVVLYASPEDNRSHVNDNWVKDLNQLGVEVVTQSTHSSLEMFLADRAFDLIWVSWLVSMQDVSKYLDTSKVKIIYDTVDVHFLRESRQKNISLDDEDSLLAQTCYGEELELMRAAQQVVVVSEFEQKLLRERYEIETVIVGNIEKDITVNTTPFEEKSNTIAFVGSFLHGPNVSSMQNFLDNYWDRALQLIPDLQLKVMGNKSEAYIKKWSKYKNVTVMGWVESVEDNISDCKLTIAPLTHGAGVKGKVNQSLSCGIPVLASPIAGEGMTDPSGEQCGIIVKEISDFPEALHDYLYDLEMLEAESNAGVEWVQQICGYETAEKVISNSIFSSKIKANKRTLISLIGNCQVQSYAMLLERMLDNTDVETFPVHVLTESQRNDALKVIETSDIVITQPLSELYGVLETAKLKKLRNDILVIHNLFFKGLHPDFTYLPGRLQSPLGDYNSQTVYDCYQNGLSIKDTLDKFLYKLNDDCSGAKLAWDTSYQELLKREKNIDVPFAEELVSLTKISPTFYTFNHPKLSLLYVYLIKILKRLKIDDYREMNLDNIKDPLESNSFLPIGTASIEGVNLQYESMPFIRCAEESLTIEKFVKGSFSEYKKQYN